MRKRLSDWLPVVLGIFLMAGWAFAQSRSEGGERGSPPGGSTPGGSGRGQPGPTTPTTQQPSQQENPLYQQPRFLRGKVILDDGSPPPPNVIIERVCNGTPRPEAYTDSKGGFSFQLGSPSSGFMPDASYAGPSAQGEFGLPGDIGMAGDVSSMRGIGLSSLGALAGCEIRASLPGYRSDSVSLANRGVFDSDLGTIILHRLADVQGYTISATTAQAPKEARKAYENGLKRARNGKWDKAETQLRQAVEEYPRYAVAWQALGQVLEAQQRPAEARDAYEKALDADSSYLVPYLGIALLAARESNWQEMAATSDRVLRLNPHDFPEAYYFQSVARANLNDLAGAEFSAREAIGRNAQQRYPHVIGLLGLLLADQGKYAEASEQLNRYLEFNPDANDAETIRSRLAKIDSLLATQSQP